MQINTFPGCGQSVNELVLTGASVHVPSGAAFTCYQAQRDAKSFVTSGTYAPRNLSNEGILRIPY